MGTNTQGKRSGSGLESVTSSRKLSPGPGLGAPEVAAHQLARIYEAMIQIVAEQGYEALKIRDVVGRAEVSTRAFYEHFAGKEDCFMQTYDRISRRATRRIIAAQAGGHNWRRRLRLVFEEFVRELEREPTAARLALIEVYGAGEPASTRAWQAERDFEGMLGEALARSPGGTVVPPLIMQGAVAGVAAVSRNRLLAGEVADLAGNGIELVDWAMSYPDKAAARLSDLDGGSVWQDTTLEPREQLETQSSHSDRALILSAVAGLAADRGYAGLTVSRIRSKASVSRRKFEAHFDGVEDCYLAALDQRAGEAISQAARAQTAAISSPGGTYRTIAALCQSVACDPFLARVCLTEDFPPGLNGTRSRKRLSEAIFELLIDRPRMPRLAVEATAGAAWALFTRNVLRNRRSSQISATLTYMILAPMIGPSAAIDAIEREQSPRSKKLPPTP